MTYFIQGCKVLCLTSNFFKFLTPLFHFLQFLMYLKRSPEMHTEIKFFHYNNISKWNCLVCFLTSWWLECQLPLSPPGGRGGRLGKKTSPFKRQFKKEFHKSPAHFLPVHPSTQVFFPQLTTPSIVLMVTLEKTSNILIMICWNERCWNGEMHTRHFIIPWLGLRKFLWECYPVRLSPSGCYQKLPVREQD